MRGVKRRKGRPRELLSAGLALALAACGGGGSGSGSADGDGSEEGESSSNSGSATRADGSTSSVASTSGTSGTDSASVTAPSETQDPSDGDDDTAGAKFDVQSGDTGVVEECECGQADFTYIWAANAPESTVSKIDTRTMVEEGRYPTHPDGDANPSRTSVSVDGRAVVVQNRDKPGLVKIWARPELCDPDTNGMPGLQTSNGAANVLPFDEEDCFAWWTPFPNMTVQRPVAWTQGTLDSECEYVDQKIWTVTGDQGTAGHCGTDGVWVHRLDGDTGVVEDSVHVMETEFPCLDTRGAYGGAVDHEGNFWFSGWQNNKLARIDFASLQVDVVDVPGSNPYGITVDTRGRPWLTWPIRRYDPVMDVWDTAPIDASTGIAEDGDGRMWVSDGNDLVWIDRDTMAIGNTIVLPDQQLPQAELPRGIAVDVDGMVWVVRRLSNLAYRVDPQNAQVDTFDTLNGAYTYSDMTGGQIQQVTCNPPG